MKLGGFHVLLLKETWWSREFLVRGKKSTRNVVVVCDPGNWSTVQKEKKRNKLILCGLFSLGRIHTIERIIPLTRWWLFRVFDRRRWWPIKNSRAREFLFPTSLGAIYKIKSSLETRFSLWIITKLKACLSTCFGWLTRGTESVAKFRSINNF
jgi:hypothetical protein